MSTKQTDHWQRERDYWTSKVAEYTDKLSQAKTKRDDALAMLSPFKVGQEVEYVVRGSWVPAIVRMVEPNAWGDSWYQVSLRKKNGEWADRTQRAYGAREVRALSAGDGSGPNDDDPSVHIGAD